MTDNQLSVMTDTGMVDKISKVLNQAERAPEGSPEREAFMEKALAMSQAYSIDLAIARSHQAKKERAEKPERRTFTVGERGPRKVDARVWRANFYAGFVNRTRYRLREARNKALREAGIAVTDESDSRAVALRDKAKEVREAFEENERFVLNTGRTYDGAQVSRLNYDGRVAGDEAGKRARLGDEKDLGN